MNAPEKMKRLKRSIRAFESLKSAETARHAALLNHKQNASKLMAELDSVDPDSSIAWYLFPAEWLTFRANLDKEVSKLNLMAEYASIEIHRMEKVKDRLKAKLDDISAAHNEKTAADEMTDFITNSAHHDKSALGKFAGIDDISRKS